MKFSIKHTNIIQERNVIYYNNEFSFDTEPGTKEVDFELSLNKLILSVVDNQIIQIWGFSGGDTKRANLIQSVPSYKKGILMVEGEFEYSFNYSINKVSLQVYENEKTGWFCIGNPEFKGEGVEFILNCIAFIDSDGSFISLWIKPSYQ